MPPQNPYQPSAPPGPVPDGRPNDPNSYDFIMNPQAAPKQRRSFGSPSKLLYVVVGGAALVVILLIFTALRGGGGLNPSLVSIAQQQTEIARVAGLQYDNLSDDSTKAFVLNTQLSMQSAQADYLSFLSDHGSGIKTKLLAGAQNSQTDTVLSSAQASGTLNSTLTATLQNDLGHYQQTINAAYGHTRAAATHKELKKLYDQAGLLIEQSKQQ